MHKERGGCIYIQDIFLRTFLHGKKGMGIYILTIYIITTTLLEKEKP